MKRKSIFFLLIVLTLTALFMSACSSSPPVPEPTLTLDPVGSLPSATQPEPTVEDTPVQEATLQPANTPSPENAGRIQYQILAELDYPNRQVWVDETIIIPHPSNQPLNELILVVPPNAWWGVFQLLDISWVGAERIDNYSLDGVRLTIPLSEPWQPGESRELNILYKLDLPAQNAREGFGPSPFGFTAIQTNLVDWYPMVPEYREEGGWTVHDPWIFGEYLVYPQADFEVILDVENPALVVAASSLAEQDGDRFHYHLEEARNFVFSISPDYVVLEDEVNGTIVYGYVFSPYLVPGRAAFKATLEALALYSDLFGSYLQPSFTMVQADFNHGMEYEGLYFQSRGFFDTYNGTEKSYLITIAVHETAHQWWYGQVANDQAMEPWLDEALCTFSELIYYERLYPQAVDWWWATRVNFYEPTGVINRSIYDYSEFVDQYLAYRNATYLQGAKFLNVLRIMLGDEAMISFLGEYADSFDKQIASGEDFFSLLSEYVDVAGLEWLGEYFGE